ncbi:MAG: cytochrome c [Leptothrix ochracea]|uniref:c-type cytochrome n=1 Tax=Leptothrix ochracea TaxID=735331 RepID=UPI0034E1A3D8
MKKALKWIAPLLVWAVTLPMAAMAQTGETSPSPIGFGNKDYRWERMTPELPLVLALDRDAARGREAYRGCRGCHKDSGIGLVDGTYPRLAGQHAQVILKQATDTRAGIRVNPKMEPFAAEHVVSQQELADIAEFLSKARTTKENGKGAGDPAELARAKAIYNDRECGTCHGDLGEGVAGKFYPAVAGQHYGYLLRELEQIQEGKRGNGHPDMIKRMKGLSGKDLEALSDYMSRMTPEWVRKDAMAAVTPVAAPAPAASAGAKKKAK